MLAVFLQGDAQDQLHRASERTEDASRDAKQQMSRARDDNQAADDLQGGIGTRVQFACEEKGRGDTGGSSSSSSGSYESGKGLGGAIAVSKCCVGLLHGLLVPGFM
jgi:hypothetical protein